MHPVSQTDSLSAMFARFKEVNVRSGHMHTLPYSRNPQYPVFKQIISPALSGDVFSTDPDPILGAHGEDAGALSEAFSPDGTASTTFLSARYGYKPFRVYDMNSVMTLWKTPPYRKAAATYKGIADFADSSYTNVVFVNWWESQEDHTLEILEKGKPLQVSATDDCDPYYAMSKQVWYTKTGMPYRSKYDNYRNCHMFKATASSPRSTITVRILDKDGKILYKEKVRRPKSFRDGEIIL